MATSRTASSENDSGPAAHGESAGRDGFNAFRQTDYFPNLDGLRGLAILLVLFHHVPHLHEGWLEVLQLNGRYGVSLFFVISGFLICTLLLRERRTNGRIAIGKFFGRRAVRLLPLYYAVLLVQAVLVFGLKQYTPENQALFVEKLPSYLFYYSNWLATATQGPFFCAWSLAVEEQFYVGFALLLLVVPTRGVIALFAAALAVKLAVYEYFGSVDADSTLWRIVFSYQEPILWGVLLAFAFEHRPTFERLAPRLRWSQTLPIAAVAVTAWLVLHPKETSSTWDAALLYLGITVIVGSMALRLPAGPLGCGLLVHVGRISYGIYLLHMLVISAVKKIPGGDQTFVCFAVATPLSIVAATVSYRYFEQPLIRRFRRRLLAQPQPTIAPPIAPSAPVPVLPVPTTTSQ